MFWKSKRNDDIGKLLTDLAEHAKSNSEALKIQSKQTNEITHSSNEIAKAAVRHSRSANIIAIVAVFASIVSIGFGFYFSHMAHQNAVSLVRHERQIDSYTRAIQDIYGLQNLKNSPYELCQNYHEVAVSHDIYFDKVEALLRYYHLDRIDKNENKIIYDAFSGYLYNYIKNRQINPAREISDLEKKRLSYFFRGSLITQKIGKIMETVHIAGIENASLLYEHRLKAFKAHFDIYQKRQQRLINQVDSLSILNASEYQMLKEEVEYVFKGGFPDLLANKGIDFSSLFVDGYDNFRSVFSAVLIEELKKDIKLPEAEKMMKYYFKDYYRSSLISYSLTPLAQYLELLVGNDISRIIDIDRPIKDTAMFFDRKIELHAIELAGDILLDNHRQAKGASPDPCVKAMLSAFTEVVESDYKSVLVSRIAYSIELILMNMPEAARNFSFTGEYSGFFSDFKVRRKYTSQKFEEIDALTIINKKLAEIKSEVVEKPTTD